MAEIIKTFFVFSKSWFRFGYWDLCDLGLEVEAFGNSWLDSGECLEAARRVLDVDDRKERTEPYLSLLHRSVYGSVGFLHLLLGHSDSQHPILHRRLHLLQFCILRQPESADELAVAPLDAVPLVVLLLFLFVSLSAYLKNTAILNLNLHFLFLQFGNIHFKQVSLRRLFPVDPSVCHRGCFSGGGKWEALKWVPNIQ